MSTPSPTLLDNLHAIAELTVVSTGELLEQARADKSGFRSDAPPLAVVEPRSVTAVQEVMALCHETRTPVVARGGGSGLAGGAIAGAGEVVLSLAGLDRILEISPADRLARVQAGVINETLNQEAKRAGLWFGPDPSSRAWSTVGGNIATNAGGLLCAKYGVTREAVLALSVVLADGSLIHTGHRSVKGVTGLDLTSLFIGSEGLLGVIVEATVRLLPLDTSPTWTLSARFSSLDQATAACQAITEAGHTPAILELIDSVALKIILGFLGEPILGDADVLVIAQADGLGASADIARFEQLCLDHGASVEVEPEGEGAERLLSLRRSMHSAMEHAGQVLIEDVSVPRSQLGGMFSDIRSVEAEFGVSIPTVAHAADGNLHPNFVFEGEQPSELIWEAAGELFQRALQRGGTLTGEHGVGLLKRRWLKDELGERQWEIQRQVKSVFDPLGLLNPGKVFEP